jgi:hypothetical protein
MPNPQATDRKLHRDAFLNANTDLLERCCRNVTSLQESDMEEMIAKARIHFNYSPNTRAMDIKRAVLTAFRKQVEERARVVQPRSLLMQEGSGQ